MFRKVINYSRARLRKFILEEFWYEDLVKMGMKVGDNCSLQPGITFDYSHCWLINIGNNVTIAPQAYLLAHDASTKSINNYTKISGITIEDHVFIGARALIMPGVTIGKNSIVAAGSVVTKSIPENCIAAGNPAKVIADLGTYKKKIDSSFHSPFSKVYDEDYTLNGKISREQRKKMYEEVKNSIGFVR